MAALANKGNAGRPVFIRHPMSRNRLTNCRSVTDRKNEYFLKYKLAYET